MGKVSLHLIYRSRVRLILPRWKTRLTRDITGGNNMAMGTNRKIGLAILTAILYACIIGLTTAFSSTAGFIAFLISLIGGLGGLAVIAVIFDEDPIDWIWKQIGKLFEKPERSE
jgi:hypothetical protein